MLRKIVVAALLYLASLSAGALEFTDVYYSPNDGGGWGVFVVQSDTFQFLAFFVYGQDGKPTWYSCQLTVNVAGSYTGTLYASTGSYYAAPWDPTAQHTIGVGSCTFSPIDIYNATLTYSLTNGPTVVKQIQRFPLTPYVLGGNYSGSMTGSIGGCNDPSNNDPAFRGRYGLNVTQNGDQSAALTFTFVDMTHTGIVCTLSGPLTHYGRLYQLNGQASCVGPNVATGMQPATINSFHSTGQGIEGHWTGGGGGGCTVTLHFAAVQIVNN
ncbi:MAG TPA: hypothetical protein VFJ68_01295 [Casimicrobiaceae bacterium]|nr:hypothetical protein [Casimicrobiaceae bacterium]